MSDAQLAVLLRSYLERLATATQQVRDDLPDSFRVLDKDLLQNPIESVPILEPIYQLMNDINKDVDFLSKREL